MTDTTTADVSRVPDCRGQLSVIAATHGDNITMTDGFRCSWMHCCDWPERLP
jgi:hypothetical protein